MLHRLFDHVLALGLQRARFRNPRCSTVNIQANPMRCSGIPFSGSYPGFLEACLRASDSLTHVRCWNFAGTSRLATASAGEASNASFGPSTCSERFKILRFIAWRDATPGQGPGYVFVPQGPESSHDADQGT